MDLGQRTTTALDRAMEATLFTGWIYDLLKPLAEELKVAHPPILKAIAAAKKNDKVDVRMIADLLRCNLLPQCCMGAPLSMCISAT
jgi:hypothetical protein